ncbi:hypothetical protein V2P20_11455 [Methylobacter sp. Wu1]|uniref:hypothetical protein n=1 Tax=Methylobacter sp. Wu1 TaxID=3119359 RepID=UPI002F9357E6
MASLKQRLAKLETACGASPQSIHITVNRIIRPGTVPGEVVRMDIGTEVFYRAEREDEQAFIERIQARCDPRQHANIVAYGSEL